MLKPNLILQRLLLTSAVTALIVTVSLFLVPEHSRPTDCELARGWYKAQNRPDSITPVESFEIFLEKRFRIIDIIVPGGLFTSPEYSVAIHYPKIGLFTEHDFLISRDGVISAQRSISMRLEEWNRARKITCININGDMQ